MSVKNYHIILFSIIIGLISACNSNNVSLNYSQLFAYPEDSLQSKKTFIYLSLPDSTISYRERQIILESKGKMGIDVSYFNDEKKDSTVFNLTDDFPKIESTFTFIYDSIKCKLITVKREIVKDDYIPNENPFGNHIIIDKFKFMGFLEKNRNEHYFAYDTVYLWNNNILPAQYFQRSAKKTVRSIFIPFIRKSMKAEGYGIYAKDVGLVEHGIILEDILYRYKLIEIE